MLTLDACEFTAGQSPEISVGKSECALYLLAGSGSVEIDDRSFHFEPGSGVYVRRNESFRFVSDASKAIRALVVACPSPDVPLWKANITGQRAFDDRFPDRVATVNDSEREATGDRSFRILVGPKLGSQNITQFIGSIPRSRAPEHYHLYEEVICVLSGEGLMWFADQCVPVRPGSLIFLPRKQPHCLECTVDGELELVGIFYPAGSPSVNYKTGE